MEPAAAHEASDEREGDTSVPSVESVAHDGETRTLVEHPTEAVPAELESGSRRKRQTRPFPSEAYKESLSLVEAILRYASSDRVDRLLLLKQLDKAPGSSATRDLISNANKYGLITGNFNSDELQVTPAGMVAANESTPKADRIRLHFSLAIKKIRAFNELYDLYKSKKMPAHEFLKDAIEKIGVPRDFVQECADIFVVNANFVGLLQTISGSSMLVPLETAIQEVAQGAADATASVESADKVAHATSSGGRALAQPPLDAAVPDADRNWARTCFYISAIGDDASEVRKHSDLFLSSIIEPALDEVGFDVVRADRISEPGMITAQVIEHLVRAGLAIVDLSWHNPNAFYEMAVRHVCKLPTIQICRKADKIPFDVNQVRTIVIDTTDIYTMIPKLQEYRAEVASQARAAISGSQLNTNPISVYFPGLDVKIPESHVRAQPK